MRISKMVAIFDHFSESGGDFFRIRRNLTPPKLPAVNLKELQRLSDSFGPPVNCA